jgi:hypothetical protein
MTWAAASRRSSRMPISEPLPQSCFRSPCPSPQQVGVGRQPASISSARSTFKGVVAGVPLAADFDRPSWRQPKVKLVSDLISDLTGFNRPQATREVNDLIVKFFLKNLDIAR